MGKNRKEKRAARDQDKNRPKVNGGHGQEKLSRVAAAPMEATPVIQGKAIGSGGLFGTDLDYFGEKISPPKRLLPATETAAMAAIGKASESKDKNGNEKEKGKGSLFSRILFSDASGAASGVAETAEAHKYMDDRKAEDYGKKDVLPAGVVPGVASPLASKQPQVAPVAMAASERSTVAASVLVPAPVPAGIPVVALPLPVAFHQELDLGTAVGMGQDHLEAAHHQARYAGGTSAEKPLFASLSSRASLGAR